MRRPGLPARGWTISKRASIILRAAVGITFVIAFITGMNSLTYWLTGRLYDAIDFHPSSLLAQAISTVVGLLLTFLIIYIISELNRSKMINHRTNMLSPIIQALERIAQGDFSVQLDVEEDEHNDLVAPLMKSINAMALELNTMEALRQEFISNVSHEIQSPLTSIRGFAQALQNNQLDQNERTHYLDIIIQESRRLSRITDNLLRLAALDSDKAKFEPTHYRLDRQIRNIILVSEPQWTEKDIEMDIALDEIYITADQDLMSQVWMNLLHNSIKFTPKGGHIYMRACRQADTVKFSIADTGIGMSLEDQARIFERFYKADQSRTNQGKQAGSGLGLSIVKKIIEMHSGTIEVRSEICSGTTFYIDLPIDTRKAQDIEG